MKKLIVFLCFLPVLFSSCSKDDDKPDNSSETLITPDFETARLISRSPFTGLLIVTPAQGNGSVYYGNYNSAGVLTPVHATYTIVNGAVARIVLPIKLPVGDYTFVYWGLAKSSPGDSIYSDVTITDPAYVIGTDMKTMYYKLRKYSYASDTTYYPVYDYVHAIQALDVGADKMSALLQRVTAGLRITLDDKNGGTLAKEISSVRVLVGSIASQLNYYTGEASDYTKTVSFSLTRSADNKTFSANSTVMMFPSAADPLISIVLTLANGKVKVYRQHLDNTLSAGTRLTLTASIGEIYVEETGANGFEMTNWTEKSENIDFGVD